MQIAVQMLHEQPLYALPASSGANMRRGIGATTPARIKVRAPGSTMPLAHWSRGHGHMRPLRGEQPIQGVLGEAAPLPGYVAPSPKESKGWTPSHVCGAMTWHARLEALGKSVHLGCSQPTRPPQPAIELLQLLVSLPLTSDILLQPHLQHPQLLHLLQSSGEFCRRLAKLLS